MKGKRVALGVVPAKLGEMVRSDAKKFKKSMDSITEAALQSFFRLPSHEREKLYKRFPSKVLGRPL